MTCYPIGAGSGAANAAICYEEEVAGSSEAHLEAPPKGFLFLNGDEVLLQDAPTPRIDPQRRSANRWAPPELVEFARSTDKATTNTVRLIAGVAASAASPVLNPIRNAVADLRGVPRPQPDDMGKAAQFAGHVMDGATSLVTVPCNWAERRLSHFVGEGIFNSALQFAGLREFMGSGGGVPESLAAYVPRRAIEKPAEMEIPTAHQLAKLTFPLEQIRESCGAPNATEDSCSRGWGHWLGNAAMAGVPLAAKAGRIVSVKSPEFGAQVAALERLEATATPELMGKIRSAVGDEAAVIKRQLAQGTYGKPASLGFKEAQSYQRALEVAANEGQWASITHDIETATVFPREIEKIRQLQQTLRESSLVDQGLAVELNQLQRELRAKVEALNIGSGRHAIEHEVRMEKVDVETIRRFQGRASEIREQLNAGFYGAAGTPSYQAGHHYMMGLRAHGVEKGVFPSSHPAGGQTLAQLYPTEVAAIKAMQREIEKTAPGTMIPFDRVRQLVDARVDLYNKVLSTGKP